MKRMKVFWKYFLNFIVLVLLVSGLVTLGTMNLNKENKVVEYIVQEKSPIIEIEECTNNKITGTITNDSKILINKIYVKAEFYNDSEKLLGTQYYEIKYFNVGEKARFEIDASYKNVEKIKISSTEKK